MKTMINEMVRRFLGWTLPEDFFPDGGISFDKRPPTRHPLFWPSGTNLLTADQAREMFEHCLPAMWQPMETAPQDGTAVLVLLSGSDIPYPVSWRHGTGWIMTWDHYHLSRHDSPRCWMAIPDSPNPNDLISGD